MPALRFGDAASQINTTGAFPGSKKGALVKPLLITVGEPSGIGPDCILRAFLEAPEAFHRCIIVAPCAWLEKRGQEIGFTPNLKEHDSLKEACKAGTQQQTVLHCWNPLVSEAFEPITAGMPSVTTAKSVIACIESASHACLNQEAAAVVTGPIEKSVLKSQGFQFPGHTEFLAHLAREKRGYSNRTVDQTVDFVMMLASEKLRVALLTTHMALSEVPSALSIRGTLDCLRIVDHDLKARFGISRPRLGLCGLNPHAGEQGHFGSEEIDILTPAAKLASRKGLSISGPLPADTLFSVTNREKFDAIVCCYHDQALIPIKTLSFGGAVNITLGLPFVRTSVDHGTALDLVGTASVSYSSLLAAISMAREMSSEARGSEHAGQ